MLCTFNSEQCSPPLGKEEVLRIARSVARYAVIEDDPKGSTVTVKF